MAIGFRSLAAFWIGGISSLTPTPQPACPCPDWLPDGSLANTFVQLNETSCLGYDPDATLQNVFIQKAEQSSNSYTQGITLTSGWIKRNCE